MSRDGIRSLREPRPRRACPPGPGREDSVFEISTYPLQEADGGVTRVIHLSRDITLGKNLEQELWKKEKLNAELELAGGASLEINRALTVIIAGLENSWSSACRGKMEGEPARTVMEQTRRLEEISR